MDQEIYEIASLGRSLGLAAVLFGFIALLGLTANSLMLTYGEQKVAEIIEYSDYSIYDNRIVKGVDVVDAIGVNARKMDFVVRLRTGTTLVFNSASERSGIYGVTGHAIWSHEFLTKTFYKNMDSRFVSRITFIVGTKEPRTITFTEQ